MIELLKLALFPHFYFASTPIVDGGAEVADTGGGGGDEAIVTDDAGTADGQETAELADAPETTEIPESVEHPGDGRTLPNAIKQAFAKLKEIDPKAADLARRSYYEAADFKRVFPNVNEARDAHDLIESVGGTEGISGLQKEANDYATELTNFANGNPQSIEEFARDSPQGLVKLTPLAVEKMRQIDGPGYERMASGIVASTLRDKGVTSSISRIIELIGDGKQTQAHELATKVAQWISGVDEFAKTKPASSEESPEAKSLREERANLNREKENTFKGRVGSSILSEMNQAIDRALVPYLKTKKLTNEQRQSLQSGIRSHITKGFETNQAYQGRMKALLAQGDEKAIQRYIKGQLDADRILKSVKSEWSLRGFSAPSRPAATNGNAGTVTVAQKPNPADIDWSKDRSRQRFMSGEATLKTGKVVKWNFDSV